jgi:3-oxoacyl-[acyl-carrier protein] reductase
MSATTDIDTAGRRLQGRVAIVTGGASGIGAAVARRLASEGARVAILDLDAAGARALADDVGGAALEVDVSDSAAVDAAFDEVERSIGPIDIVVNNAGIATDGNNARVRERIEGQLSALAEGRSPEMALDATVRMPDDEWNRMIAVNLSSVFFCTRRALRSMQPRRTGAIVNIASICGIEGCAGHPHYSAAKGGILAFTRAVSKEVIAYGVRVNAVAPGFVDTPMAQKAGDIVMGAFVPMIPQGRLGRPEEVAAVVAFLASDEASYFVGDTVTPSGGFTTV